MKIEKRPTIRWTSTSSTDWFKNVNQLTPKILSQGKELKVGVDNIRVLDSSHPHTPPPHPHQVVWFHIEKNLVKNSELVLHEKYIDLTDQHIKESSRNNSDFVAYCMISATANLDLPEDRPRRVDCYDGAIQTLPATHVHLLPEGIPEVHEAYTYLEEPHPLYHSTLSYQCDLGSQLAMTYLASILPHGGEPVSYQRTVGIGDEAITICDQAMGYQTLFEALDAAHNFSTNPRITSEWEDVIQHVANNNQKINSIPGAFIIRPSTSMRNHMKMSQETEYIVHFGSNGSLSHILPDGAISVARDKNNFVPALVKN